MKNLNCLLRVSFLLIAILFSCSDNIVLINDSKLKITLRNGIKIHNYNEIYFTGIVEDISNEGYLISRYEVSKGFINGYYDIFYSNGNLKEHINFTNGIINDYRISFYKNGMYKEYTTYLNGFIHGSNNYFWPNGLEKATYCFENGIKKGTFKTFYSNGNLKSKGEYGANETKTGLWKYYNQMGELIKIEDFSSK